MERIWLKNYPDYITHDINSNLYQSLVHFFESAVEKFHKKPALHNMGSTISYKDLDAYTKSFAAYLQQKLGLKKGDRLGIMLPNVMQYFVAIFGALRAGLTVVNINPLYTPREFEHQVNDAKLDTVIVLANFLDTVKEAYDNTRLKNVIVTEVGDMLSVAKSYAVNFAVRRVKKMVPKVNLPNMISFKEIIKKGRRMKFTPVDVQGDDIAFLQYTGGTTGVSKGAMLTHKNVISNVEQCFIWMASKASEKQEVTITALPLYHIFSLTLNCFVFMKIGVKNVLITNPTDIAGFVKELRKHPFTIFMGVNTLFKALMRHKGFHDIDFRNLKIVIGGGMAVHKSVADDWKKLTGVPLLEAYGLTEASPAVCCNLLEMPGHNDSIGFPMSSTEVKIVDDDGKECSINEPGELWVRGPQVMKGYWEQPEETEKVLTADGWLRTGDIAKIDDEGLVYIVDRKKDMIVVSGYNVFPNEVEAVLSQHPDIAEVAVLGIPSERTGEFIKAFIVKRNENLTRADVIEFARDHLTTYKVPKHIEFRESLPKSTVGKILRRKLKEEELAKTE